MAIFVLAIVSAALIVGWTWRELVWRERMILSNIAHAYLLDEVDNQRKFSKDKLALTKAALEAKNKKTAADAKLCHELWNDFWVKLFETSRPGMFNPAQDCQGRFLWQRAIEAFMDLRRFRGTFTPEQLKHMGKLVLTVKRAVRDQERAYQSVCPTGTIEFDGEGGFKVSS